MRKLAFHANGYVLIVAATALAHGAACRLTVAGADADGGVSSLADGGVTVSLPTGSPSGNVDASPSPSTSDDAATAPGANAPDAAAAPPVGVTPPLPPGAPFATRCAQPGVVKCVGFDVPADISGGYGDRSGIFAGAATPELDTTVKASGASSLKFTVPASSPANVGGSYFTNFSDDLSVRFGESSELFVQWRQRFTPELLQTVYAGGGGWKQVIIGTGDTPNKWYASCTALETVVQNTYHRGFPVMYNSCTGSTSHGPYNPFEESFSSFDFKLQNGRPAPYCLYSQGQSNPTKYFAPSGNCFGYVANEWMTFQVRIKTGPRVGDEFAGSYVSLWVAREGQPSELVVNWGPYNLTAGAPADDERYGKVWLLPYNTGKDATVSNPVAFTWYDDLIIATQKIADP